MKKWELESYKLCMLILFNKKEQLKHKKKISTDKSSAMVKL